MGGFFTLPDWGAYIWRGLYIGGLIFGIFWYSVREAQPASRDICMGHNYYLTWAFLWIALLGEEFWSTPRAVFATKLG